MKQIMYIAILLSLSISCSTPVAEINTQEELDKMIQTDKDFSAYSLEHGTGPAFIAFADKDLIMVADGGSTIVGIDSLTSTMGTDNPPGAPTLEWEPLKAEISSSGDLGYTFGKYKTTISDSLNNKSYRWGTYVSVWKKQSDGTWKWVIDAGNSLENEYRGESQLPNSINR